MNSTLRLPRLFTLGTLLLALGAPPCQAKVGIIPLSDLSRGSDLILIAKITNVETSQGIKIASIKLLHTIKGEPPPSLGIVAQSTWTCDTSDAYPGEKTLLFLDRVPNNVVRLRGNRDVPDIRVAGAPLYYIAHSGRGRMLIEKINGIEYAGVQEDGIRLPSGLRARRLREFGRNMRYTPVTSLLRFLTLKNSVSKSA